MVAPREFMYTGVAPYACASCEKALHVFIRTPSTGVPTSRDWRIVCPACESVDQLDAFEDEIQKGLRTWALPGIGARSPVKAETSPAPSPPKPATDRRPRRSSPTVTHGGPKRRPPKKRSSPPALAGDPVWVRPSEVKAIAVCPACDRPITPNGLCGCS